jgi:xanthine dehydrogenase accessory factor
MPAALLPPNLARCLESRQSHYTTLPSTSGPPTPVLWEYLPPPLRLVIFGAGNDAMPFSNLAKELGWRVVVADPRPAYATRERFPLVDEVRVVGPEATASLGWDPLTVAVVMTHHYRFDLPILRTLLTLDLPYIGLLGPKKRAEQILGDLRADGLTLTKEMLGRLHGPVGLDLGGSSPETVALAIAAEIQAVLNTRDSRPLRERTQPIHPRS